MKAYLAMAALQDAATVERFWSKVERGAANDCWPWKASRVPTGYGLVRVGSTHPERAKALGPLRGLKTHRFALALHLGREIGEGLSVCHRCDNPSCCNPAHLFEASHQENMRDRNGKGRQAQGERQARARLTVDDVRWMRWARQYAGTSYRAMADACGVSVSTVGHAVTGLSWDLGRADAVLKKAVR